MLEVAEDGDLDVVVVTEDGIADRVDFSAGRDGRLIEVAQVKSSGEGRKLSAATIVEAFTAMVATSNVATP